MKQFYHDTDAWKDDRIMALRAECGGAAVDAYYTVIEHIYRQETHWVFNKNQPETKSVSAILFVDVDTLETWIKFMLEIGLLFDSASKKEREEGSYILSSERAEVNIDRVHKHQETARQNGKKGGRPPKAEEKPKSVSKKNPAKTQTVFEKNPDETNAFNNNTLLDIHKVYPNKDGGSAAAAAGAAPQPPNVLDNADTGDYTCPDSSAEQVRNHFKAMAGGGMQQLDDMKRELREAYEARGEPEEVAL